MKISSQTTSNFGLIRHLKCSHTQKDLDNFNEIVKKNKASAKTMTKSASSLKKIGFKKPLHDGEEEGLGEEVETKGPSWSC